MTLDSAAAIAPRLNLEPADAEATDEGGQKRLESACRIEAATIICPAPAGRWDVKLLLEGHAPLYRWDVAVAPGQTVDLGEARLIAGASLAGWVVLPRRSAVVTPGESATFLPELLLEKAFLGWIGDPRERQKMDQLSTRTRPNEAGFFQLTGIDAGAFRLEADLGEDGEILLAELELSAGEERFLVDPLEVPLPEPLQLFVDPPVAGDGLPWRAKVSKLVGKTYLQPVAEGAVDESGAWTSRPLLPGSYELTIEGGGKSIWHKQTIDLTNSSPIIQVDLPLKHVEGELLLGEEPLEAELIFGTLHGLPQIRMRSDEEGAFAGSLPRAGEWRLDVLLGPEDRRELEPVDIDADEDPAQIEVVLPANTISGKVTRYGAPVEEAYVTVFSDAEDPDLIASTFTDAEGEFTVRAVRPGAVGVSASDLRIQSGWTFLQLAEDTEIEGLHLELAAQRTVRGRVLAWPGGGVPGVEITAESGSLTFRRRPSRTLSAVDGSFELTVPEDHEVLDLILIAPGFGVQMQRLALPLADYEAPSTDVELPPITLHRERVAVRIPDEGEWWLASSGAAFPVRSLVSLLHRLDALQSRSTGLWLAGLAPKGYAFCQGPGGPCIPAEVSSAAFDPEDELKSP